MSNKDKSGQKQTVSSKTPRPAGKGRIRYDVMRGSDLVLTGGPYRVPRRVSTIDKKLEALSKAHSELERKVQLQERELAMLKDVRFSETLIPIERDAILTEDIEWALQRAKRSTTAQTIATAREAVNKMGTEDLANAASRGDSERAETLAKTLAKLTSKP